MKIYCRLCAVLKSSDEFKCKIDDQTSNIEQKLVACCNWNSYRSHRNLPQTVCIPCYLQLQQCWYFSELVARAQQKLCDLMKIDISLEDVDERSLDGVQVKEENLADETVEEAPIEVSTLKFENDYEDYADYHERSDDNDDDDDGAADFEYNDGNNGGFQDQEPTNDVIEDTPTNMGATVAKPKPKAIKMIKRKDKTIEKESVGRKQVAPKVKKSANKLLEFDIKSLLSHEDVNENGTIKPGIIQAQNFCDWKDIKNLCYLCSEDFISDADLWAHFTSTHSNEKIKFLCPICPEEMIFLSGRYYRSHIAKAHFPHLSYCCHRCQTFFYDKKRMREHQRSHPKDSRSNMCTSCGKTFAYYKNLHFHMLSHLPVELQPQYECYLCKKSLKSHQSIQKHMKFHVGVFKSAICDQCGKAFLTASKLKKHMTAHTDERPFQCGVCNKTFKTNAILRRHGRIHQNFRKFCCHVCGHRTLDNSALKQHVVRHHQHANEAPFPCQVCGKRFYSARTMKNHQKNVHSESKPFPCDLCDHRAVNQNALQRHHKHVHLDHRPHACPLCEYRTYSKYNLRLHTSRRHFSAQTGVTVEPIEQKYLYANVSEDGPKSPEREMSSENVHKLGELICGND